VNKIAIIFCVLFVVVIFVDIQGFVDSSRRGILLFGTNLLPILFPFFFVTGMFVGLGFRGTWLLGYLGGYPTGAKILAEQYERGEISRTKAIRVSTYTSTVSPIFVIATVGTCFLMDTRAGVVIFVCHILGACLNGLVYCGCKFRDIDRVGALQGSLDVARDDISKIISDSLYGAIQNVLMVGGVVVLFFIFVNQLGVEPISGILELTNGVFNSNGNLIVLTAIVSFGGLAIAVQGLLFFRVFRMPFWFYLLYKVTHAILAVLICVVYVLLIL